MKTKKTMLLGSALAASMFGVGCTTVEHTTVKHEVDHGNLCTSYANQQDYQNALAECKAAVAQNPSARNYMSLGVVYMQLGKPNLALEDLKRAERINPSDSVISYNLAAAYSLADKTDLSLRYVERALVNGFNDPDAWRSDPDLQNVRSEPEFRRVLESHGVYIY